MIHDLPVLRELLVLASASLAVVLVFQRLRLPPTIGFIVTGILIGPNALGYGWFPITMGSPPDPAAFESANDQLLAFLDAATRRYPIDGNKLALLGFSQGGVMAYSLALRQPKRFAALAALSTWLPPVMAGSGEKSLDQLPVLVQHGTRERDALDLPARERARRSIEKPRQVEPRDELVDAPCRLGYAVEPREEREVLTCREIRVEHRRVREHAEVAADLVADGPALGLAVEDLAARRPRELREERDERALARAVRALDHGDLAGGELEVDAGERAGDAVDLRQAARRHPVEGLHGANSTCTPRPRASFTSAASKEV